MQAAKWKLNMVYGRLAQLPSEAAGLSKPEKIQAGRAERVKILTLYQLNEVKIKYGVRAFSSVGRASPLQGEGRGFKSLNAHHL